MIRCFYPSYFIFTYFGQHEIPITVLVALYYIRRCLAQIATKGSCMPNLRGIPGKPWRPIARTSNYYYYYPAHAQRMRRSVTDIYIYIYTHRESLVRNHEPCAKAPGNYITNDNQITVSIQYLTTNYCFLKYYNN